MPLHFHKEEKNFKLGVWKIEENQDFFMDALLLTKFDSEELDSITAENKRLQWLASRYLLKNLLQTDRQIHINKDTFGKPFIEQSNLNFSISHCRDYAAVIISKFNCGIDVETIDPRIERIAAKFLYEHEIDPGDPNFCKKLTIYWSVKETLYKMYGRKGLTFKTQLLVEAFEPIQSDTLECFVRVNGGTTHFDVSYREIDNFILSYVMGSLEDHSS